jgi:hypothetical protein
MAPRAGLAAAFVLASTTAGAAGGPVPVPLLRTAADEESPAAGGRYLAWTQNSTRERRHFDVYARSGRGRPWRVNPPGAQAKTGGIDAATLVYEEIRRGQSDLRLYDVAHRKRMRAPAGVNTAKPETSPSLFGRWLLFSRIDYAKGVYRILLRNLRSGAQTQLDVLGGHNPFAAAGQVNGRYVVWTACPDGACNVYRYDILSRRRLLIPNKDASQHAQYGPSVTRDGTVYYGRSGFNCGSGARLMRYSRGSASTVFTFPSRQDFATSYADDTGRRTEVLFDRARCAGARFDIYEIVLPRDP